MPDAAQAPFTCTYTPEVPDLLAALGCSLILTTYQAGKVIILSADGENLIQLARHFKRPMGMAVDGNRMAVATKYEVVVLENAPQLARRYPRKPNYYDALYVPRAAYFTGQANLHDMAWGPDGALWAVNTLFSCLGRVTDRFSFEPMWTPAFISQLKPEDRCHLNGMAMQDGQPRFATALGATDTRKGWREDRLGGGLLIDTATDEVILGGLPMPHSPRLYGGALYLTTAATGDVLQVDPQTGTATTVNRVPGFARGLAHHGDYLFVGHSRIRKKSTFGDLPIADREHHAGITLIHLPTGRLAGQVRYHTSCEEIYDIHVLPGLQRPGLVGVEHDLYQQALHFPEAGFWGRRKSADADAG